MSREIPDAVAAIIAAAIREQPATAPEGQARHAVAALLAAGWSITAPEHVPTPQHAA